MVATHGMAIKVDLSIEVVAQQIFDLYNSCRAGIFNICSSNPISVKKLIEERLIKRGKKNKT
jgi:hypothetical protein